MDKFNRPVTPQERKIAGISALVAGVFILAISMGLLPKALDGLHAPLWVVFAAGGVFTLAGVSILLQGSVPSLVSGLIMNVLLTLFAAIPAWIAWGDGQRKYSGSGNALAAALHLDAPTIGHMVFAISAMLMAAFALVAWWTWFAKLNWRILAVAVPALALAGYALLVVLPAEPRWSDVRDDHERLARYASLSEQEGVHNHKGNEPASWYFVPWRNYERWTQAARSRLAAARNAPQDATVLTIPVSGRIPVIDGLIGAEEWLGALRIALVPGALGSSVQLMSDGKHLYLAADVPADTTETGYDQFRFWFHLGLSPWLDSERVIVGRRNHLQALRTIRIPQASGAPIARTDWHIFERMQGATAVTGHRQYELQIDLEESGIRPGVPFATRLDIEGDPVLNEAGKFKARTNLGGAGNQRTPLWLRVGGS